MSVSHQQALLNEFRHQYRVLEGTIHQAFAHGSDVSMLERLLDRVGEYETLVREAHRGCPTVVTQEQPLPGHLGRPRIQIDCEFLAWAYKHRSISSIARFLGVHRHTVRRCLIDYGIIDDLVSSPDPDDEHAATDVDDILDPNIPLPRELPPDVEQSSFVAHRRDTLLDAELDEILAILRSHYHRAGLSMLDGMLRQLGYSIPRERVRASLLRIDPVRRVFERIRIRRREYRVAGPNALWHHDGQHGKLYLLSVHNIRIERLWVDVTTQVGAKWADLFNALELHHGLDADNPLHIWLLHLLFLHEINEELAFFAGSWNHHRIAVRNGPRRSPADMYGFDMLVHGMRGDAPGAVEEVLDAEELEVYGVDWEALRDDGIRAMHSANNPSTEGWTSWIGQRGTPTHLNEVNVEEPDVDGVHPLLLAALEPLRAQSGPQHATSTVMLINRWITGLAIAAGHGIH
ncbi:hypothetical protein OH77DRAFT_1500048 [Trametes cingulata]|nr:hypothetical protein OH77DRAFT_1500048 [Trametes cingulata]